MAKQIRFRLGSALEALWMPFPHSHGCFLCLQDKKGLSGKQNNFERKAVYQRQVRAPSLLAKSILEGKITSSCPLAFKIVLKDAYHLDA